MRINFSCFYSTPVFWYIAPKARVGHLCLITGRLGRIRRRADRGTNRPNGGLFHATAATNPICAGAGSGRRAARRNGGETHVQYTRAHSAPPREAHHHQQRNPPQPLLSGRRTPVGAFCVTIETRTIPRTRVPIGGRRPHSLPPYRRSFTSTCATTGLASCKMIRTGAGHGLLLRFCPSATRWPTRTRTSSCLRWAGSRASAKTLRSCRARASGRLRLIASDLHSLRL